MHGILYVDENGNALSPLITWQDERGNLQRKNLSYAKELSLLTSYEMATGFGVTTLFFDLVGSNNFKKTSSIVNIDIFVVAIVLAKSDVSLSVSQHKIINLLGMFFCCLYIASRAVLFRVS